MTSAEAVAIVATGLAAPVLLFALAEGRAGCRGLIGACLLALACSAAALAAAALITEAALGLAALLI